MKRLPQRHRGTEKVTGDWLVSVIIAPIVVQNRDLGWGGWLVVLVLLATLVWAIRQSKKSATIAAPAPAASGD